MIILEKPYVSREMAEFLAESGIPVLDNATAWEQPFRYEMVGLSDREFAYRVDCGERLYTTSEHALDWVFRHVGDKNLLRSINCMKDKSRLREALREIYPDYFFREVGIGELPGIDVSSLPLPLVLKPAVGFFSVGVYVVADAADWRRALADIFRQADDWREDYPEGVVDGGRFILEEYIDGDEFAVDAYYDDAGEAVALNIMKHDFSSASDVRDRLYYSSPEIIREHLAAFTGFLDRVGAALELRNFPMHAELRVSKRGIIPIEFNPLRFAGWCSTDLAWFAYGMRTYEYYLRDRRPNWNALLAGREGNIHSLVILDKPACMAPGMRFDYDALYADFSEIMCLRKIEFPGSPIFGYLFARTPAAKRGELERITRSDLTEYLRGG